MKLEDWRNEIDAIDAEIVRLINQRAKVAEEIGFLKAAAGLPVMDADREEAILRGIREKNSGTLNDESLVRIFRRIMLESRTIQTKIGAQTAEKNAEIYR